MPAAAWLSVQAGSPGGLLVALNVLQSDACALRPPETLRAVHELDVAVREQEVRQPSVCQPVMLFADRCS